MTGVEGSAALTDLSNAVAAGDVGSSTAAALKAFRAKVPPVEVVRATARAAASRYDSKYGTAPRALAALAAASNVSRLVPPELRAFPILQAVALAASDTKSASPGKPRLVVSGEVIHLARSFLFAVRADDLPEAESIFLGMVEEGWERKMAGDMLFRAAAEDMGEGGRKLVLAVKSWQLAQALGFKDSRTILRPAVQYLVRGPRDRAGYATILRVLGTEWVDLEALGSGGRPLDDAGRSKVAGLVAARPEAAISETLALLREGYAATSIAEGLVVEAANRLLVADGTDVEAAQGLMFAHAARFALTFSRSPERLHALFQAALRVRGAARAGLPAVRDSPTEAEELRSIVGDLDARHPAVAAARVRSYTARGFSEKRLLEVLVDGACRDSSLANGARNLILADVCSTECLVTKAPEPLMALATAIAASKKDPAAYESWRTAMGL